MEAKSTYQLFAEYYDLYVGTFDYDLNCYVSFCKPTDIIVEIGCGTGRVLKAFLEKNYTIIGVDISDEMIDLARKKLQNYISSKKLFLQNFDFTYSTFAKQFDKALVSFFTFNYITERPEHFLRNIYQSSNFQGAIMMDLFVPGNSSNEDWHNAEIHAEDRSIQLKDLRFMMGEIEKRIQLYIENGRETRIETQRRYFSPVEVKNLLEKAGFHNIEFSLNYNLAKFAPTIDDTQLDRHYLVKAEKK